MHRLAFGRAGTSLCRDDADMHSNCFIRLDGKAYPAPRPHTIAACAAMYPKGCGTGGIEICHGDNPGSGTEVVIQCPLSVVLGDNVSSI